MSYYNQLTQKERRQIKAFLDMDWPIDAIASRIGRHRSTIYRELKRNRINENYFPVKAHTRAQARKRRKPLKIWVNSQSYKYVMKRLKQGWSPEQIAGRMRRLSLPFRVCHETIYQYVYRHAKPHIFYYLPQQRPKRLRRRTRKTISMYAGVHSINNRPEIVDSRTTLGHWEGDTIRFAGERWQSITTLVERKSRFLVLQKNARSTTRIVMNNIRQGMNDLSKKLWQTITFDQGREFADYACVERKRKCQVFYAHASSPWLRGTNENTNKRLRRYLPKRADIQQVNQDSLDKLAKLFNNTPRKCLDYLTPKEVLFNDEM